MSKEESVKDGLKRINEQKRQEKKDQRKAAIKNSKIGRMWNDLVFFTAFLTSMIFAGCVIAAGAYAIYKGLNSSYNLARIGLVTAGAAAAVQGLSLAWNAVMKVKG